MKTISELINPVEMCAMFKLISINIRMIFKTNKHYTLLIITSTVFNCIVVNNGLTYDEMFTFLVGKLLFIIITYVLHSISLDKNVLIKCVLNVLTVIEFPTQSYTRDFSQIIFLNSEISFPYHIGAVCG